MDSKFLEIGDSASRIAKCNNRTSLVKSGPFVLQGKTQFAHGPVVIPESLCLRRMKKTKTRSSVTYDMFKAGQLLSRSKIRIVSELNFRPACLQILTKCRSLHVRSPEQTLQCMAPHCGSEDVSVMMMD